VNAETLVVMCGSAAGAGIAVLVSELVPAAPKLGPALRRLNPPSAPRSDGLTGQGASVQAVWGGWLCDRAPGRLPRSDLRLLGQSPEQFLFTKAVFALAGLLLPVVVTAGWALMGLGVPVFIPGVVGIVAAAGLWFLPDWQVRDQASRARIEFAHAAAAYLELVALRMASNVGASQALEEAAWAGRGWAFTRLQDALLRARTEKSSPWEALDDLGEQLTLPILSDIADIMRLSSTDGAAVYATLRARAASLRTELLAAQAAEANADSEKMSAPGALLAAIVMIGIAFPAVLNMLFL
jgi:Flp pilus assembly protein TadB